MSRHRLKLPADLLLLIKAVATIEGVGRQLDPSFKMVEHARRSSSASSEKRHRPRALARRTADAGREALRALRTVPRGPRGDDPARRGTDGLQVQFVHRNLDYFVREMDRVEQPSQLRDRHRARSSSDRRSSSTPASARTLSAIRSLGVAGFITAGVLGIGLAIGILRSGRL